MFSFRDAWVKLVEANKRSKAFTVAQHLVETNSDFKNWSVYELADQILDEDNPVYLDKSTRIRVK